MKSLLLPLVACAALAGCADYGTVAYNSYPGAPYGTAVYGSSPGYAYPYAYGASPAYPYSAYDYAYGGWPNSGWAYGGPALGLTINSGRFHRGHDGDRAWNRGGHEWHRGDRATAGMTHRGPDTNALGAGSARMDRGNGAGDMHHEHHEHREQR